MAVPDNVTRSRVISGRQTFVRPARLAFARQTGTFFFEPSKPRPNLNSPVKHISDQFGRQ